MIRHHPRFELLFDYAAGIPSEGVALAVATHAALCPACRTQIAQIEAVAGTLLEEIEPEPIGQGALAALLDRLHKPETPAAGMTPILDEATRSVIPPPLRRYVEGGLDRLRWRSIGPFFRAARLPLATKDVRASLLRLGPRSYMPRHTHRGYEYSLVLAGGYRDGDEQFGLGDFAARDAADQHQPVADEDGECLCLVVLDAPPKLTGPFGRLVNPFLRI